MDAIGWVLIMALIIFVACEVNAYFMPERRAKRAEARRRRRMRKEMRNKVLRFKNGVN